jgi:hypothetical protein
MTRQERILKAQSLLCKAYAKQLMEQIKHARKEANK